MAETLCPVWIGYLLSNPMRKWLQNPEKILAPYLKAGMTVMDIGCAMGFFSLPLAHMVGEKGKVICVDIQEKMIQVLEENARKAQLSDRIRTNLCSGESFNLNDFTERVDFALAFAVVHEVQKVTDFFIEIHRSLKPDGRFLMAEPKLHVSQKNFNKTVRIAEQIGFQTVSEPQIPLSKSVIFEKKSA